MERVATTPVTGIDANANRQQWAARATKETTRWEHLNTPTDRAVDRFNG